jgi:hypothetical protein
VVRERLRDREQHALGRRVGDVRVGRHRELRYDGRSVRYTRVIHEEAAVGLVAGMERQAEQSALAAAEDLRRDVEEDAARRGAGLSHADHPALLDHEEAVRAVLRRRDEERSDEAGQDRRRLQLWGSGGCGRGGRDQAGKDEQDGD